MPVFLFLTAECILSFSIGAVVSDGIAETLKRNSEAAFSPLTPVTGVVIFIMFELICQLIRITLPSFIMRLSD